MTDPTADAAKLLRDDLTKLLAQIEDGPYIGAEGVTDAVLNWASENIADLSRELVRGTLQNTRPQPAPGADAPELDLQRQAREIAYEIEGGLDADDGAKKIVALASRPQPAPPAGEPDELDAILARAAWALFDATKNYPIGCQSPGWVPECVEAQRLIAEYQRARRLGHAARQQQKASAEPTEREGE